MLSSQLKRPLLVLLLQAMQSAHLLALPPTQHAYQLLPTHNIC
jgi:hypothetical protein